MMKLFFRMFVLMAPLLVAGCSSDKPIPDPAIAACPEARVSLVQDNQRFLDTVKVGETKASKLSDLEGLRRKATLVKSGEKPMDVWFYQTGLPGCPWAMSVESLTPVVIKDKVIVAYGTQSVKDMTAHGWVLKEATWPWQRYDFGYLPRE